MFLVLYKDNWENSQPWILVSKWTGLSSYQGHFHFRLKLQFMQMQRMCTESNGVLQVPHVRQLCNWDCGLACVLMVLKVLGVEGCDLEYLSQLCQTTR